MTRIKNNYSIEKGFISKLIETGDFKTINDKQIKPYFLTGENRRVFNFLISEFDKVGKIPTARVVSLKFPNFNFEYYYEGEKEVVGTEEPLLHWCEELRNKAKHNSLADITEEIAQALEDGDTEKAHSLMKSGVLKIGEYIVETSSVDITKNVKERKKVYLERKKNKGMLGIPTGIAFLDKTLKGLVDSTLTTVLGTTGLGKSWLLVLIGAYAQLNGYKVVCFLTEMSAEIMQDRFEAMLFGMRYGELNYSDFKNGALIPEKESEYFEFLEEDLPNYEPLIIETATGISSVVAVIEREKPDLVLIDSAYLMEDEQGAKDDWLRVTHITRDLKRTAKNKGIPIVINTQADKTSSKRKGAELGDIMYAQSIGMDSDNVIALYRDEVMYNDKEMGIKVLKQREGVLGKGIINWNFDIMDFSDIYSDVKQSENESAGESIFSSGEE